MKISIEFLPASVLRYATSGDWFERDGVLHFQIAKTENSDYDYLVLLHEMTEWFICHRAGVTEQQVDEWDMAHLDSRDPGDEPGAPYGAAHGYSMGLERMLAAFTGIDWNDYDRAVLGETA